jgi:hypothetical protein
MYIVFVGLIIIALVILFIGIPTLSIIGCNGKNNDYTEL